MRRSNLYTLRRISCEKQVVPVRVSHATREIETQVEGSARRAQGERKESARRAQGECKESARRAQGERKESARRAQGERKESARRVQGECKGPVTRERRSSLPACISPLARAFLRFPCVCLRSRENANVRHDTINFCVLDCFCARFDKAWLDYQMALKISPQNSTALNGNYR